MKSKDIKRGREYHVEISNMIAALKNLDAEVDINRASKTIKESIKILYNVSLGYYE
jgi:hypothetical protein